MMITPNHPYVDADEPGVLDQTCVDCGDPCETNAEADAPRCPWCERDHLERTNPDLAALRTYYAGLAARGFAAIVDDINSGRRAA